MKGFIFAALVVLGSADLHADTFTTYGGMQLCTTEKAFDDMAIAQADNNESAVRYLLNEKLCFEAVEGAELTIIDTAIWKGSVTVRYYAPDGSSVDLWVDIGAIPRG